MDGGSTIGRSLRNLVRKNDYNFSKAFNKTKEYMRNETDLDNFLKNLAESDDIIEVLNTNYVDEAGSAIKDASGNNITKKAIFSKLNEELDTVLGKLNPPETTGGAPNMRKIRNTIYNRPDDYDVTKAVKVTKEYLDGKTAGADINRMLNNLIESGNFYDVFKTGAIDKKEVFDKIKEDLEGILTELNTLDGKVIPADVEIPEEAKGDESDDEFYEADEDEYETANDEEFDGGKNPKRKKHVWPPKPIKKNAK